MSLSHYLSNASSIIKIFAKVLSRRRKQDPFALRSSEARVSKGIRVGACRAIKAPSYFETPYGPSARTEPVKKLLGSKMILELVLHSFITTGLLLGTAATYATVPLAELSYISMAPQYTRLSPAMGALCQDYAKNLMLLGDKTSEAVIVLHQLYAMQPDSTAVGITHKSTAIGHYLEPRDIGTLIGILVHHTNKVQDVETTIKKINELLKVVVNRNQSTIKSAITNELKNAITRDNNRYLELEKKLLALANKKDRTGLENALKEIARESNNTTETAVVNAFSTKEQRIIWQEMRKLHHSLQYNRKLLDTEQRTCEISSPMLKDSMGALKHALIGAASEEGPLYVPNNTIYLLLAFLWEKAKSKDDLREAYDAMAQAMAIEQNKLYTKHRNDSDTSIKQRALLAQNGQAIEQLLLEDIVFARLDHTLNASEPMPHTPNYYQRLLEQYQHAQTNQQKELLEILLAAWAPTEADVQTFEPRVTYCRFLMQPANTLADRIALVHVICNSNSIQPIMINAYLDALTNMYHCLPETHEAQEQFFDSIITCLLNAQTASPLMAPLKKQCTQWIQHADTDVAKTAILSVFMKHHLFDATSIEDFRPFDQEQMAIAYANTIQSDSCKAKLIITIMSSDSKEKDFFEWVLVTLPTIKDEHAQTEVILYLTQGKVPTTESLHTSAQQFYAWTTATLGALKDDMNKTDLVIAALTSPADAQYTKQNIALRNTIVTKTLPTIHADNSMTVIMNHIASAIPGNDPQLLPVWHTAFDWLTQQVLALRDEERIITLVHALLDTLDACTVQDQELQGTIYSAVEKSVHAIHTEAKKLYVMQMILDRSLDAHNPHMKLYKSLYQWIEAQSATISDSTKREELLRKLLSANKNLALPAENTGTEK